MNRCAKIQLSSPHWADFSCDLIDLYNGDNVLHGHHVEGEQMEQVCLAFKSFKSTLSWSRGLLWLPHTPLAQAQVFPRPNTLCDCGMGYFFFSSKGGERKVRKGAPAAPGNYYSSSSSTQESKQFLESTFVKRQLQWIKINGHECQQLTGSLHFMVLSLSGLFSCFSYYGPRFHFPEFSSHCFRDWNSFSHFQE